MKDSGKLVTWLVTGYAILTACLITAIVVSLGFLSVYCVIVGSRTVYAVGAGKEASSATLPGGIEITTLWPGLVMMVLAIPFAYLAYRLLAMWFNWVLETANIN